MAPAEWIEVEVAYARPDVQVVLPVRVPRGSTAEDAVRRSGLLERFPEIELSHQRLGVFGELADPARVLRAGERVEVYRPLAADPKAVRKARARRRR